jgi:hypothetical protein
MRYYDVKELFDNLKNNLKKYPKLKITFESNPKTLTFSFISNKKTWDIGLSCMKSDIKLIFEIIRYIKLSPMERVIKEIIE